MIASKRIKIFKLKEKTIALFLLTTGVTLNYLFDGVNKIGELYIPFISRSAIFYRLTIELICIFILISFFNKKRLIWIIIFFYFLICFFIGNIYLKYIIGIDVFLIEQFIYFNKYFFIFFIFFATYKVLEDQSNKTKIISNLKKVFLFNGALAILGLLFQIKLFSTFPLGGARFGYDGLIFAQNEASIFYLLCLFVFYFDWISNKQSTYVFLLSIFLCLITGMKAVILGVVLLSLYHFLSKISLKKLVYLTITTIGVTSTLIFTVSKLQTIFGYYYYSFINKGFVYMILGGRNTFIETRVLPYLEKWSALNYLIGGQNISNVNEYLAMVELDFIDLMLFFGILNSFAFLFFYKYFIIGKIKNTLYLFIIGVFFLLSFFSGHFFTSSVNPIFIIIVFSYINNSLNEKYQNI